MWPTAPPAKRGRPGTGTGRYAASRRRSASNGSSTVWRSGGRPGVSISTVRPRRSRGGSRTARDGSSRTPTPASPGRPGSRGRRGSGSPRAPASAGRRGRARWRRLAACAPRPARCAPRASFRGPEGVLDALVLAQAVHHLARLLGGVEAPHLDAVHGVAIAHHAHQGGVVAPAAELLHEAVGLLAVAGRVGAHGEATRGERRGRRREA